MSDFVAAMWGIIFLVAIFGGIPYSIWVIYSAFKKRWRRVGIQISAPVIIFLILSAISYPLNQRAYSEYLHNLFDTNVKLGTPLYEYNSPRALQGDGYSFSVYELPVEIRKRFESADERLLSEFPKRPSYRNRWSSQHWVEGPLNPAFEKYVNFVLAVDDADREKNLLPRFEAMQKAISHGHTYYSFFYFNNSPASLSDIDLFIVDLDGGRLYIVNLNT